MPYIEIDESNLEAFQPYIMENIYNQMGDENHYGIGLITDEQLSFGAIVLSPKEDELRIRSLYLDPKMRGKKHGTDLLLGAVDMAISLGFQRLTAAFSLETSEENAQMGGYLEGFGFQVDEDSAVQYHITVANAKKLPILQQELPKDSHVVPWSALTLLQKAAVDENEEIPSFLLPVTMVHPVDEEVSHAYLEDGVVKGYVLFSHYSHTVVLCAAYCSEKGLFQRLLLPCIHAILQKYDDQTTAIIVAANERAVELVNKLCGDLVHLKKSSYLATLFLDEEFFAMMDSLAQEAELEPELEIDHADSI